MLKEINEMVVGEVIATVDANNVEGQKMLYNLTKGEMVKLQSITNPIAPIAFAITCMYDNLKKDNYYRLCLLDADGAKYTTTSKGIIKDMVQLYDMFGNNFFNGENRIKVMKKSWDTGYTYQVEVL